MQTPHSRSHSHRRRRPLALEVPGTWEEVVVLDGDRAGGDAQVDHVVL